MYWYQCEKCGAHLDPGEHCDCEEEAKREAERRGNFYKEEAGSKRYTLNRFPEKLEV